MSDGNRGYFLVAAIAALFLVGILGSGERRCQRDYYSDTAYNVTEETDGHQAPRFDRAWLPCVAERATTAPYAKRSTEKDQRDLIAQESMALWAFWVAVFAGFTAMVTSVGTLLIWRQVSLTRKAVEDTGRATLAMEENNDLARKVGERGWLKVEMNRADGRGAHYSSVDSSVGFLIPLKITNVGRHIATDVVIETRIITTPPSNTAADTIYDWQRIPLAGYLMPDQSLEVDAQPVEQCWWEERLGRRIWVESVVSYRVALDKEETPPHATKTIWKLFHSDRDQNFYREKTGDGIDLALIAELDRVPDHEIT